MKFTSSPQTIAWFLSQYKDDRLTIKPPFQRKPVWSPKQKCYLIESILEEIPVPEVYVQVTTDEEGQSRYAVVDGQQRIRTILQFIGRDSDPEEQESNKFVLDKLPSESKWFGKSFADLSPDERKEFFGYELTTRQLKTESEFEVRDVFKRLNRFLSPLKPQEIRNATYSGPFARLASDLADLEYWAENKVVTAAAIRRMNDIEFVSELLIGVLHGPQGGSAAIIDEYYRQYEDYEDEFPGQKKLETTFQNTLSAIQAIFADIRDTRWANKSDFYSLFVAIGSFVRDGKQLSSDPEKVRKLLTKLASEIDEGLADEDADISEEATNYVRNVEKGANDKARRAYRHEILVSKLSAHFKK